MADVSCRLEWITGELLTVESGSEGNVDGNGKKNKNKKQDWERELCWHLHILK